MSQPSRRAPRPNRRSRRPTWRWGPAAVTAAAIALGAAVLVVATNTKTTARTNLVTDQAAAPDGQFTTIKGTTTSVRALRGQAILLWFVTTFCGSCQAGTQAVSANIDQFTHQHVKVVELELADNLGGSGPDIASFAAANAKTSLANPNWVWGTASQQLTTTYDPGSYLDIYYLIDPAGHVVYANSSPDATMSPLLGHVRALTA